MKIIAKTLFGLEDTVAAELKELGASSVTVANRAVIFEGELPLLYTVNYMSRTALSFLVEVSNFRIKSVEDLYNGAMRVKWDRYMKVDETFSVVPVVNSDLFNHTGFAALKVKDAIADYFRKKGGKRPSVNTVNPDIIVNLHISHNTVTISLDSSGDPLFMRGYRILRSAAPLNEALAAGMIRMSGWDMKSPLIDPMCGSGTIAIEAALMATGTPPGKFRNYFAFQRWIEFDSRLLELIMEKYDSRISHGNCGPIFCSDISQEAINNTKVNLKATGIEDLVETSVADFRDLKPPAKEGLLIMNPPYGERLEQGETNELYSMIGSTLKHNFEGFTAWIISSSRESLKFIGLKPSAKHVLFNGALECRFDRYDLYSGSRKQNRN